MRLTRPLAVLSSAVAGLLLALAPAGPAAAHHGWEHFDTTTPYYLAGTVTAVRWGNPHPEVTVRIEEREVPSGWAEREIPPELEEIGGRRVLAATRAYPGDHEELRLVLAPIERLAAWGMPEEVRAGERLAAVGYLARDDDAEIRPELVVLADGRTVRQRSVPLPVGPVAAEDGAAATGTSGGPAPAPDGPAGSAPVSAPAAGEGSALLVWSLLGGAVLVLLVGGGLYVARRGNRE